MTIDFILSLKSYRKEARLFVGIALRSDSEGLSLFPMYADAAIGFRMHTGWAAMVAIAAGPGEIEVLLRRRIELLPKDGSIPRFVYHKAAELNVTEATRLISSAEMASREAASIELRKTLEGLGPRIKAVGISAITKQVPQDVAVLLRSHPMIHTAEGALFQRAVTSACQLCGLKIISGREKEIWTTAAQAWGLGETVLRKRLDGLRKSVGAPWGTDQKMATAFALLALK